MVAQKRSHKKYRENSAAKTTGPGSGHRFHGIQANARALKITGWLTGIYFLIELGLGYYSGSVAVISDAFHTFSAVGGVLIALIANRISMRPAGSKHTFGMMRMEIAGALLNGVFLLLMALYILWMGFHRLQQTIELPTGIMFLSAAGGLVTEFISMGVMWKGLKGNLNMKGAFWHVIQTFVGSILIIVAALVINLTGWYPIDPILGMLFGLVLLWASWGIIRDSFDILLEATPQDVDVNDVRIELQKIKGVKNVHHIHAWSLTSGKNLFMAHAKIEKDTDYEMVLDQAYKILIDRFGFYFITLQVENLCRSPEEAQNIDYARHKDHKSKYGDSL